jgi:hypothetical protein
MVLCDLSGRASWHVLLVITNYGFIKRDIKKNKKERDREERLRIVVDTLEAIYDA